jgi:hypothetical protein
MSWLAPDEIRERAKIESTPKSDKPNANDGPANDGPANDGPTNDGPTNKGPTRNGSGKNGSGKDGSGKNGSGKNGSGKDGSGKNGALRNRKKQNGPDDSFVLPAMTSYAEDVYEALQRRGALFYQELKQVAQLLPGHLDIALAELAALGLATSDSYAAIRAIVSKTKTSRRRIRGSGGMASPVGRWSVFPSTFDDIEPLERTQRWCKQLLTRYGVVFRDLLTRESAAPPWRQLVPILRRMELRGEVRGGRFVEGVAGEQFAEPNVVEALRNQRDAETDDWLVVSAADPVNQAGVVTDEPRVSAIAANSMILWGGRCIAAMQGSRIEFFVAQPPEIASKMRHALQTGRRQEPRDWAAKFQRRLTQAENDPQNESPRS